MKNKKLSPVTEQSEQATAYAADERTNLGFTPQYSATTDSNSSAQTNNDGYFWRLAQSYGAMQPELCFQNIAIDPNLMAEIRKLKLAPNQEYFLHEVIRHNFPLIKEAFMDGTQKVEALIISRFKILAQMGSWNPPKSFIGMAIGIIESNPFPKVSKPYAYQELLAPDKYAAPHDAIDFVNKKLHEACPQFNLCCIAENLDTLVIIDVEKLAWRKL